MLARRVTMLSINLIRKPSRSILTDSIRSAVGLAEHSNVMGKVLASSYFRREALGLCSDVSGPPKPARTRIAGSADTAGGLKF